MPQFEPWSTRTSQLSSSHTRWRARRAHRPPLLAQALAPGAHQEAGPPRARRSRRYGRRLTADPRITQEEGRPKKSCGGVVAAPRFAAPVTSPSAQAAPCVGACFKLTRPVVSQRRSRGASTTVVRASRLETTRAPVTLCVPLLHTVGYCVPCLVSPICAVWEGARPVTGDSDTSYEYKSL